jgi:hypothetical protein
MKSESIRGQIETKAEIVRVLQRESKRLRTLGVRRIGLFGSFVRGDQGMTSDIDLLVEFIPERKTFDNFMQLSFFLEDLLGRKVELVTFESLSPHIGPHILKEVEFVSLAA